MSLDGTDCPINEPSPFSARYYSHKLNGPGYKYEVGLCIRTGDIVWVCGGVPCGQLSDLGLARQEIVDEISAGEMVLADDGYKDANYFVYPQAYPEISREHKAVMARHETVNGRIKNFEVCKRSYRHNLSKHHLCFFAVVNLVQLSIDSGETLYNVDVDALF